VIHTPWTIQAKIHALDQRLAALNRRWTFSQITDDITKSASRRAE
jgi:hypothetical protein